jgi:peptidoglycan/xylan/chitin deacetylase (PgdA/CDA1 family)
LPVRIDVASVAVGLALLLTSGAAAAQSKPLAFILMYHHVADTVLPGPYARALTITPNEFASQLAWLRNHGCAAVTVSTIVGDVTSKAVHGCEAAITLDDGYDDALHHALPIIKEYGDVATLYISTGLLDTPGHLTAGQLNMLADVGIEIGAHTVDHVDLTTLNTKRASAQIAGSSRRLARIVGHPIFSFAYPAGQFDVRVKRLVKTAGFRNATTTQPGELTSRGATADLFALPRYRIEHNTGMALIRGLVDDAGFVPLRSAAEIRSIARARAEGNDMPLAERIGAALLDASYPEQVLKVRALRTPSGVVMGVLLSAVKPHSRLTRASVLGDAAGMADRALDASPAVSEVDIWATVPLKTAPATMGDSAAPASRTVFSAAITRAQRDAAKTREEMMRSAYVEALWLKELPQR